MLALLLIQAVVLVFMPLVFLGVINKTKAMWAGRTGPSVLQPCYDVLKLLRKGSVFSETTTWIFRAAPVISVAAIFTAALLVPLGFRAAPLGFTGDFIAFAYLLGLARFLTTTAALDTGSAFEGMGAAREVSFATLTEPALFFGFLVLAKAAGDLELGRMLALDASAVGFAAPRLLVSAALFIVLLAEGCRIPVDDPNTHLELTMIHEVMVLDHGGPLLGWIHYGAALKLFALGALVVQVAQPMFTDGRLGYAAPFAVGMFLLAILIGTVESFTARLRFTSVPNLLLGTTLLSAFAFVLVIARAA